MNIINADLVFSASLEKRPEDLYTKINTKILFCSLDTSGISIDILHQEYKFKGEDGIPYHYYIDFNGDVYLLRNRAYKNGLSYPEENIFSDSIAVLLEGQSGVALTENQKTSAIDLASSIIMQDGIFVGDIYSETQILTGQDSVMTDLRAGVSDKVAQSDNLRIAGDNDTDISFSKLVSRKIFNTFSEIYKYTDVPSDILKGMNPHLSDYFDAEIPAGKTIFIPKNKMTDYLDTTLVCSIIGAVCKIVNDKIKLKEV